MLRSVRKALSRFFGRKADKTVQPHVNPDVNADSAQDEHASRHHGKHKSERYNREPGLHDRNHDAAQEQNHLPDTQQKRRRRRKKRNPEDRPHRDPASRKPIESKYLDRPDFPDVEQKDDATCFSELAIANPVLWAIRELNFKECTPIQAMSLPHTLVGKDVGGKAQTGTGKTAAFLISAFTHMLNNPKSDQKPGTPRALVLAPTRELAIQICKDADSLGRFANLNCVVIYGGENYDKQRKQLSGLVDIVVATPGRLLDYMSKRAVHLKEIEMLIIDEADRMLDMGFIPDVRRIVYQTPPPGKRQTLMFSATLTNDVMRLVDSWMRDPEMVEIEPDTVVTDLVEQIFYSVSTEERLAATLWHLQHDKVERVLIFANRKDTCEKLARDLATYGVECALLSGDVAQKKRGRILEDFRAGKIRVIVATDVAARGIHVDDVSHVINYDVPYEPEDYVHRIGRTGRAGSSGRAITLVCEYGAYELEAVEAYIKKKISCDLPPEDVVALPEKPESPAKMHHFIERSHDDKKRSGSNRGRHSNRGRGGPRNSNRGRH